MPYELSSDYCSLEVRICTVDVPLLASRRDLGTVSLTLRELPYAIKKSTEARFLSAQAQLQKAADAFGALSRGEDVPLDQLDAIGLATGNFQAAQLEVIKWGVVDHKLGDFTLDKQPVPFESVTAHLCGESFQICAPRTLRLYKAVSPVTFDAMHWGFLGLLCDAVLLFQEGKVLSPEEIYERYERRHEDKKKAPPET